MPHGPQATERKAHADLSERLLAADMWADIGRKTLIVAIVSFTVWAACALLRRAVEFGTERLFGAAEASGSESIIWGGAVILLVMLIGGAVREAQGDGIDRALESFHSTYQEDGDDAAVRYAAPTFARAARKIVMTILTIGTGGSGGLEAPGVYVGESVAAGWSKVFRRPSADELRLYQLAGIAAAIGTLLAAPFTAALFAAELVYAGRIIYRTLAYCLIAGVLAYELNVHLAGHGTLFNAPEHSYVFVWQEYLLVILVAVGFSAPAAIVLGPTVRAAQKFFSKIPVAPRAAVGAVIAGAIGIVMWAVVGLSPQHILGIGEGTLNNVIEGSGQAVLQVWWILLLAVAAKTLATAATVKSGGSVGLLFPSMYLGALVGAAAYYLLLTLGLYPGPTVAVFVATGMAAALTSIAGVPLASIALVLEAFGAEYGPAAALACAICFTASRRFSLYARPSAS
jgi:CIC family chloride channel protein